MRNLKHLWHTLTGWHELPAGMTARITPLGRDQDGAAWETLTVHIHGQTLAVTYPTEHECNG